jgi:hypothetical protein
MTAVGLSPDGVDRLVSALRRQAHRAATLADDVHDACSGAGCGSSVPHLLDELARDWSIAADLLAQRLAEATGLQLLMPQVAPPAPPQGAVTPAAVLRALPGLLSRLPARPGLDGAFLLRELVARRLEPLLLGLTHDDLTRLLTKLPPPTRGRLIGAFGPRRPELVQRLIDALPPLTVGAEGPAALRAIAAHLPLIALAAGHQPWQPVGHPDLTVALRRPSVRLPPWLVRLVESLHANPVLFSNIATAATGRITSHEPGLGTLDTVSLDAAIAQQAAILVLADRELFARLDAVTTGTTDNRVSVTDIEAALDAGWLGTNAATALAALLVPHDTPSSGDGRGLATSFDRLDSARPGPRSRPGGRDGLISYDDVIEAVVDLQVFADDPSAARRFVLALDSPADDISGRSTGSSMRAHSDEGVRALARAALTASGSLLDQVLVVSRLPESRGGERNRLITLYYAELAGLMNERLNAGLSDPDDPTQPGHSGANWMMYAPFAAESMRPALIGEQQIGGVVGPNWSDRQYLADANQYIFGDVAPRYAAFLEAFPVGVSIDSATLGAFFVDRRDPLDPTKPLFRSGHDQLRDGLLHYAAVLAEDEPLRRQRLTFMANALVANHEQAGAQRYIEEVIHQRFGDDGWRAALSALAPQFGLHDHVFATDAIELRIGLGPDAVTRRVSRDLEQPSATTNHLTLHDDLVTTLDPTGERLTVGGLVVDRGGGPGADIALPSLGGWSDPPPGSGMTRRPTDPRDWYLQGTNGVLPMYKQELLIERRGTSDGRDTSGTGVFDWSSFAERQWYVVSLFKQLHVDPILWRARRQMGIGRVEGGRSTYDDLPPNVKRTLDP